MTSKSPPRQKRRRHWLLKSLLILGLMAAGGYVVWLKQQSQATNNDNYQYSPVKRGDIEDVVTATGSLQPRDYVDVGTQVSGQVKRIRVSIGSEVKAGDLLAELDPVLYRAQVDSSRAQLRSQRAQLKERNAQLELAKLQYQRQLNLKRAEATTTENLQQAKLNLDASRAQIESLEAQIEQTESSLRADAAKLNYAQIYAPISGTVVSISARQGQTLNSNQQAPIILRIADLSTMTVKTQVSEADVSKLKLNMPAYFTTLGSQGQRWYGQLKQIEPTPEVVNNVVLYNALFDVNNTDQKLMTQMTAQVFFVIAARQNVLTLPVSALNRDAKPPKGHRPKTSDTTGSASGSADQPSSKRAVTQAPASPNQTNHQTAEAQTQTQTTAANTTTPPDTEHRRPTTRSDTTEAQTQTATARTAEVQVQTGLSQISTRTIKLGISNRIQAEVIEGLQEGELVVTGLRNNLGAKSATKPAMPAGMMRMN